MKQYLLSASFLLLAHGNIVAQNIIDKVLYTIDDAIPSYVELSQSPTDNLPRKMSMRSQGNSSLLRYVLNLNEDTSVELVDTLTDTSGMFHQFYSQYYKGVKVQGSRCGIHYRQGVALSLNGNFRTIDGLDITPSVVEDDALNTAIKFIGAQKYAWENETLENFRNKKDGDSTSSLYPKGEIVVYIKDGTPFLVYRFNIVAIKQQLSQVVYIDAHTGNVVDALSVVCNATGTASTLYSGTQSIATSLAEDGTGGYILYDMDRNIRTQRYVSDTSGKDYIDADNNWTYAEYHNSTMDDGALDAHWGMAKAYDFFKGKFGRKSFDNKGSCVQTLVGYKNQYGYIENAAWDPNNKNFKVGAGKGKPWSCLDIMTHEFSHAICSSTSEFTNQGENGALGEGFGDIWATCIEHHLYPNDSVNLWTLGEDLGYIVIRDIVHPECKYYKGKGWIDTTSSNDAGGVHTNCGVLTYWFYLIVNGGEGYNEAYKKYYVEGIGFEKAEKICYNAWTSYLNSSSEYEDARFFTIKVASYLYGEKSDEVIAVTNAWHAVGVGDAYNYNCSISGSKLVAKGATVTYTIKNAPSNVEFDLGGFDFVSYDGEKLTVKARLTARAYINVIVPKYGTIASQALWIGKPEISSVIYNSRDNMLEMYFFGGDPQVTSASWSVTGGGYSFYPYTKYVPYQKTGQLKVSVTATNSCGTSDVYNCQIYLSENSLSLVHSQNSRIITLLSEEGNDTSLSAEHTLDYKLIDIHTGNIVETGNITYGESLYFSKVAAGLYILNVSKDNAFHKAFKISLK